MTDSDVSVAIAGGGPTGLSAAVELGLRGISCVVLEPRREPTHLRPRAKTLNMRTVEHLRRWGLEEQLRARAPLPTSWSQDISFMTTLLGTEITRFTGVLGLCDDDDVSPVLGQQLPQYVLEELLRDTVRDLPCCTVDLGSRVVGLTQDDDAVTLQVENDGTQRTLTADYVIGADGPRSAVRPAIGAEYVGTRALRPNVGIVFRDPGLMDRLSMRPAVQSWLINERVPGLLGPVDLHGTWWLIAFGVDGTSPDFDPVTTVHGALGEPRDIEIVSTDPWTARMELVDTPRVGRVFLAGDAAHLNPPFGGHGLNTGIGDAVDLGWKLAAVADGWGGPGLLDSYQAERTALQRRVIEEASANMSVLSTELIRADLDATDRPGLLGRAQLAEEIHATKRQEYFSLGLTLGHRYPSSPIIVADDGDSPVDGDTGWARTVCAGRRLPHAWIGGESTLDLVGPEYTLFVFDDRSVASIVEAAAGLRVPLRVEQRSEPAVAAGLGAELLIVRPDQIVAWHGHAVPDDPAALMAVLAGRAGTGYTHKSSGSHQTLAV